jgi:DnaJ family protein A protein 2
MKSLYKTLGLAEDATTDDVKKAYRSLAKVHHPDKGGDEETFKKIGKAYEILSDPEKRAMYDANGDENLKATPTGNPYDLFSQMFGSFAGFNLHNPFSNFQATQPSRGPNIFHFFKISLRDAFLGVEKKLSITVQRGCKDCCSTCVPCGGTGSTTTQTRNGPFVHVSRGPCLNCSGTKVVYNLVKNCEKCNGTSKLNETREITLTLPQGIMHGEKIKFPDLGGQSSPLEQPGDLYFEVVVEPHPLFERQGDNLIYRHKVCLKESLVGANVTVDLFDGPVTIDTSELGVIYPGMRHLIKGRGMKPSGDTIVEFIVDYPQRLSKEVRDELSRIL